MSPPSPTQSIGFGIVADVRRQARIAVAAARALLTVPRTLVYPFSLAAFQFVLISVLLGGALSVDGGSIVYALVPAVAVVVSTVALAFLMTAYCYELNEVFEGRSPALLAGLRFALGRPKMVLAAGLFVAVAGFATNSTDSPGPIASTFGLTSAWAATIASAFVFPAVVTSRNSLRVGFSNVRDAIEAQWGRAAVTVAGTRILGIAIAWSAIAGAMVLAIAAVSGTLVVDIGPFGPFTMPLAVGILGITIAVAVQSTIRGLLQMALYRYAVDGSLPPSLRTDPQTLLETATPTD